MKSNEMEVLHHARRPFLHFTAEVRINFLAERLAGQLPRMKLVELDGSTMRNEEILFQAFNRTFHRVAQTLPNWDAFMDVMGHIDEIITGFDGCVTFIRNAENCLRDEKGGLVQFGTAIEALAVEWSQPVSDGQWWDRGPKAFHTVFLFGRRPRHMPNATPINLVTDA